MYIVFKLPSGAGGQAALHVSKKISDKVYTWANTHNVSITAKHSGYRICFTLAKPKDYTLFALSWVSNNTWEEYVILDDLPNTTIV